MKGSSAEHVQLFSWVKLSLCFAHRDCCNVLTMVRTRLLVVEWERHALEGAFFGSGSLAFVLLYQVPKYVTFKSGEPARAVLHHHPGCKISQSGD